LFAKGFERPLSGWDEIRHFHFRAPLLLLSGETEAYRRESAPMLDHFGRASHLVVESCGLAPEGSADPARLVQLAEHHLKNDPQIWVMYPCGLAYYRAGRFEQAIRRFNDPPELKGSSRVWPVLAMAHHRLGHAAEARQWLAKADEWYDRVTRDVLEGQDFRVSGSWGLWSVMAEFQILHREAKQLIEGSAYKGDANRKALQAHARELLKKRDKATAVYDHALMLHPEQPRLWLARGRRFAELKRWDKADADLARAAELKPDDPHVWKERGCIYAEHGRADKAAADFAKALALLPDAEQLVPDSEKLWESDRAGIGRELVQWDEVFDRVVRLRPTDARLWAERGGHFARRRQWPQAATALAKAVELTPSVHLPYFFRAAVCLELGDADGYRQTCREMLTRFGRTKNPYIADRTAKTCLLAPGAVRDLKPVMELAEQAVTGTEKNGCYGWFLLARGMADYRAGRFAGALTWINKCLAADSQYQPASLDATAWLIAAMAHHQLGRPEPAGAALDQALKMMAQQSPGDPGVDWDDWLRFQILHREAKAVVTGK
jgi:tetratricopeptide (TPR) repeat protein